MIVPPLAIPADTRAICSGEAVTSSWPMAEVASWAWERSSDRGGKPLVAAAGRSRGGRSFQPKLSASSRRAWPPRSMPSSPKPVLQLARSSSGSVPPQVLPPKLGRPREVPRRSSTRLAG